MNPIVAPIITTGMNIAGSYFAQKKSEQIADERNKQQRQWQLEDRQHDEMYNSPAMQRQRMVDAGIGGDYSNIVSSIPTESTTPEAIAPTNEYSSLGSLGNSVAPSYTSILTAQTNADVARANARKMTQEADILEIQKRFAEDKALAEINNLAADTILKKNKGLSEEVALQIAKATQGCVVEAANVTLENLKKTGKNIDADTLLKNNSADKLEFEVKKYLPSMIELNDAKILELVSQKNLNEQQIKNLSAEESLLILGLAPAQLASEEAKVHLDALFDKTDEYLVSVKKEYENGKFDANTHIIYSLIDEYLKISKNNSEKKSASAGMLGRIIAALIFKS